MQRPHRTPLHRSLTRVLCGLLAALLCGAASAQAAAQAPASCPPTAQAPTAEQAEAGLRGARDRGFLWRISKAGRSSWLYGTIHIARPEWIYPGPQVAAALEASDSMALEIDALDPSMQQRMATAIAEQPRTALPDGLQQRLDRLAQRECLPPQALSALPPEMQIAALTTLIGRRDGLDPGYGIDIALAARGHASQRTVVSLESPELQLKMLQAGSSAESIELVDGALDEMESDRAVPTLLRLTKVWADADWPALSTYDTWCDCLKTAADRAEMKRLLDDRNPALADGIDALHAAGQRVFAAVGSLHMVGPQGLPALMLRRGYRVERIGAVSGEP